MILDSSYALGKSKMLCPQECTRLGVSFSMKLVESDLQDLEPVRQYRIMGGTGRWSYGETEQSQRLLMYVPLF